ncbi:MAG: type IV pilus assembly protein PilM [Candidatus Paceibacterota bacterium]
MAKSLFDFFPPPDYLLMPAVGLDISDRSIKFFELKRKNGGFSVSKFGSRNLPPGIVESGEIKQKEKFVDFLKSIKDELGVKFVNVSLPEERAFLSRVKIPTAKEEELRGILEFQLEEHIPLSAQDAVFDFEVVEKEDAGKKSEFLNVNIVAFPKALVENYKDAFTEAGFVPLVFEMEAYASARVIMPEEEKNFCFIVDMGKTRTTFAIVGERTMQFASTIKIGGDNFDTVLVKNLDISQLKAEEIKKERGLVRSKDNEKIFNFLLPTAAAVKDEISRHIIFWNSHMEGSDAEKTISKIILCGGEANLKGLPEYLSHELKLPVEPSNPWVNLISFEKEIPELGIEESLGYAVAMGLSYRSFYKKK